MKLAYRFIIMLNGRGIGTRDVILAGPQIPTFHDRAKPHLHPADLDIALDIDRYNLRRS